MVSPCFSWKLGGKSFTVSPMFRVAEAAEVSKTQWLIAGEAEEFWY